MKVQPYRDDSRGDVTWIRELLCDAPIYGLSLLPRDYRICNIRLSIRLCQSHDTWIALIFGKRAFVKRDFFDKAS